LPSELLFLEPGYDAYCFNEAVFAVGSWIEGQLDDVKPKKKEKAENHQRRVESRLQELLDPDHSSFPEKFRNPG
jgi:hypothetical protein